MLGVRPQLGEQFLSRSRLLGRLPEEPGHVVWLHAPYGYGKSILAAQWAGQLEALGWRVHWLSVADKDVLARIAEALDLPADVPRNVVLSVLWSQPTLLVLEDLGEEALLSPILQNLKGLLLLAGRTPLHDPDLLKLLTAGRVTKLGAQDLAFDHAEAAVLIHDERWREEALAISQGWPLPLHFTALTGHAPEPRALLEGMRQSFSPEEWREALLLASISRLPDGFANEVTERLAVAGFVQRLENGFRLHPLAAETVLGTYAAEVRDVLRAEAARLPPLLQGEAYEATGLWDCLNKLLEDGEVDLARYDAEAVVRWDGLAPLPRGAVRTQRVGYALGALGRTDEGLVLILGGVALERSPDRKLALYKEAVWWLASRSRYEEALALARLAEPHLDGADPEAAGRFLNNRAYISFEQGDWAGAEREYLRALEFFPVEKRDSKRYIAETNLSIVRWHHTGDLEGLLGARAKALENNRLRNLNNVPGDLLQLGNLELLLGHRDRALRYFREAQHFAGANPSYVLIADGRRAMVEDDQGAFPELWRRASLWNDRQIEDRVLVSWVTCLRNNRMFAQGLRACEGHPGPWTDPQRALILHDLGRVAEAEAVLGDAPPKTKFMEERLYWQAAKFQITSDAADLDTLLGLTLVGARILPGLVPLGRLPRDRPELALPYALDAVLASGWKEAVELRLGELPPLELRLLGGVKVTWMGRHLDLGGRHQELLTLMALGVNKETMGEAVWPETAAKKVKNNLYVNLNALRKTLEPWGVGTYLNDVTLIRTHTDLWVLEAALEAGDHATVFNLYGGPLTPQIDLPPVAEARDALHSRVVDFLLAASSGEAIWQTEAYLRRVVDLDPLNEPALRDLLRRLIRRGRRSEAARLYRSFARRLEDELGLEPDPSTTNLL